MATNHLAFIAAAGSESARGGAEGAAIASETALKIRESNRNMYLAVQSLKVNLLRLKEEGEKSRAQLRHAHDVLVQEGDLERARQKLQITLQEDQQEYSTESREDIQSFTGYQNEQDRKNRIEQTRISSAPAMLNARTNAAESEIKRSKELLGVQTKFILENLAAMNGGEVPSVDQLVSIGRERMGVMGDEVSDEQILDMLGAELHVQYSDMHGRLYPNTTVPGQVEFGGSYRNAVAGDPAGLYIAATEATQRAIGDSIKNTQSRSQDTLTGILDNGTPRVPIRRTQDGKAQFYGEAGEAYNFIAQDPNFTALLDSGKQDEARVRLDQSMKAMLGFGLEDMDSNDKGLLQYGLNAVTGRHVPIMSIDRSQWNAIQSSVGYGLRMQRGQPYTMENGVPTPMVDEQATQSLTPDSSPSTSSASFDFNKLQEQWRLIEETAAMPLGGKPGPGDSTPEPVAGSSGDEEGHFLVEVGKAVAGKVADSTYGGVRQPDSNIFTTRSFKETVDTSTIMADTFSHQQVVLQSFYHQLSKGNMAEAKKLLENVASVRDELNDAARLYEDESSKETYEFIASQLEKQIARMSNAIGMASRVYK